MSLLLLFTESGPVLPPTPGAQQHLLLAMMWDAEADPPVDPPDPPVEPPDPTDFFGGAGGGGWSYEVPRDRSKIVNDDDDVLLEFVLAFVEQEEEAWEPWLVV